MTKNRFVMFLAVVVGVLAWALPAAAHSNGTVVTVTAAKPSEFHFTLSKTSVPHGAVTFKITNKGTVPHNFKIAGKQTPLINPGQTKSLTVTFAKAGKYPYMCAVTGHAAAGMKGTLTVK